MGTCPFFNIELAGEAGIFSVNIDPRIRAGSYLQSRFEWKSGVHRRDTNGDREIHRMIVKAIRHLGGIPSLRAIIPNRIEQRLRDFSLCLSLKFQKGIKKSYSIEILIHGIPRVIGWRYDKIPGWYSLPSTILRSFEYGNYARTVWNSLFLIISRYPKGVGERIARERERGSGKWQGGRGGEIRVNSEMVGEYRSTHLYFVVTARYRFAHSLPVINLSDAITNFRGQNVLGPVLTASAVR